MIDPMEMVGARAVLFIIFDFGLILDMKYVSQSPVVLHAILLLIHIGLQILVNYTAENLLLTLYRHFT